MVSPNQLIEQTVLKPDLISSDIDAVVAQAKEFLLYGICVPPFWVKRAQREIGNAGIKLVTVAGFPLGYQMTESKIEEIRMAIATGADEVDVVMNISAFKTKMDWVKIEIAKCSKICHESEKILKVIIETALLKEEEIVEACKICADAGVDFVKTSTGFAASGAKVEHIRLMRKVLPASVGIKASGGIKNLSQLMEMKEAGADRIGTSSGVKIMEEWQKVHKS